MSDTNGNQPERANRTPKAAPRLSMSALEALASAVLFGVTAPIAKRLLLGMPPFEASGLLYLGAGVSLGAVLLARRALGVREREAALTRADAPWLAGATLSGGVIAPALLMLGLAHASGTAASLLLNLESVFTVAIAIAWGEPLSRRTLLGSLAILAGALALGVAPGNLGGASLVGGLAIAGACAGWGLDNNLTRQISGRDPLAIVAVKGLVAGPIALALAALSGLVWPGWPTCLAALVVGALGYGASLALFVRALRGFGAARTGMLFATAPFIGALAALPILGEPLRPLTGLAGAAMLLGVVWMLREDHAHPHTHEALTHAHTHVHDAHHQHAHEGWEGPEPHAHAHTHAPLTHDHPHEPDLHHRHRH